MAKKIEHLSTCTCEHAQQGGSANRRCGYSSYSSDTCSLSPILNEILHLVRKKEQDSVEGIYQDKKKVNVTTWYKDHNTCFLL